MQRGEGGLGSLISWVQGKKFKTKSLSEHQTQFAREERGGLPGNHENGPLKDDTGMPGTCFIVSGLLRSGVVCWRWL